MVCVTKVKDLIPMTDHCTLGAYVFFWWVYEDNLKIDYENILFLFRKLIESS